MKFLRLMAVAALSLTGYLSHAQTKVNATTVTVRDSIYMGAKWVREFSNDTTHGTGAANVLPTQKAVKGSLVKAASDLKDSLTVIRSQFKPISYVPSWTEITSKPTTFTPSAHTHPATDVVGLIDTILDRTSWEHSGSDIQNKNSGNVGIGIEPTAKLHVGGSLVTTGAAKIGSMPSGAGTDSIVTTNSSGDLHKRSATAYGMSVANSAGVQQFTVPLGGTLRIAAVNDASVSFNGANNTVTVNAIGGSSGGGAVNSFNSRTGNVTSEAGDYNTSQIAESGSLYFTESRVRGTALADFTTGGNTAILTTDNVSQAFGKAQGQINARELSSNKSTSTALGTSNTLYPTQNAVKTYVDAAASGVTRTLQQVTVAGNSTDQGIILQKTANDGTLVIDNGTAANTLASGNGSFSAFKPLSVSSQGFLVSDRSGVLPTNDGSSSLQVNGDVRRTNGTVSTVLSGDASTFGSIGTSTNHALVFATNNTEKGRITAGGQFLIGTTTGDGGSALQVNGVVKANNEIQSTNGTIGTFIGYSGGGVVGSIGNNPLAFWTNGANRAVINGFGEWGFGTNPLSGYRAYFDGGVRATGAISSTDGTYGAELSYSPSVGGALAAFSGSPLSLITNGTLRMQISAAAGEAEFFRNAYVKSQVANNGIGFQPSLPLPNIQGQNYDGTVTKSLLMQYYGGNVGIGLNHEPGYRFRVGLTGKSDPTSTLSVAGFGSTDVNPMALFIRMHTDPVAANRWVGLIGYEDGTGSRDIVLQDVGGSVGIGRQPSTRLDVDGFVTATGFTSQSGVDAHYSSGSGGAMYFNPGGTTEAVMNGNGLRVGSNAPPVSARASVLQADGNVYCTDAFILGSTGSTPIAEFGLTGSNAFLRTMSTNDMLFQVQNSQIKGRISGSTGYWNIGSSATPTSTLDVDGSVSVGTRSISTASPFTVGATDHTILINGGISTGGATGVLITLPAASTCDGRIYEFIENTASSWASSETIYRTSGSPLTTISGTMVIRAAGGSWWLISKM